ncbi:MAG TPA: hypothetical protein PLH72_02000 [Vicinamibacterales bacterium]|nr:hypothetical protein [Vicinamibacterales bacterium]
MKRVCFGLVLALLVAATAWADVTIKQTSAGKGMGMSGNALTTTYIKGMKMRTDSVTGDTTRTMIYDVQSQKMYMFDSKKKEADVWDMDAFASEIGRSVDTSEMKSTVKPNGQTKQIGGHTATGYDMEISMPSRLGGDKGLTMTVRLVGPMWVVKDAPGTKDYMAFYRAAVDKGWIFSDPRAAKGSPGQAKAMAEMYKQLAETGGVPYETEMQIKMDGEGPMAAMMAKMGGMTMTSTVQSVETGPLSDDLFVPPAGYKLNARK